MNIYFAGVDNTPGNALFFFLISYTFLALVVLPAIVLFAKAWYYRKNPQPNARWYQQPSKLLVLGIVYLIAAWNRFWL